MTPTIASRSMGPIVNGEGMPGRLARLGSHNDKVMERMGSSKPYPYGSKRQK